MIPLADLRLAPLSLGVPLRVRGLGQSVAVEDLAVAIGRHDAPVGALDSRCFVSRECRAMIVAVCLEAAGQNDAVFDRHDGPLRHKRQHRMTSVAQQYGPSLLPVGDRRPAEQGPTIVHVDVVDECVDVLMPPREIDGAFGVSASGGPRLRFPIVGLDDADEIYQLPSPQWIRDDVPTGADPVYARGDPKSLREPFRGNDAPPSRASRVCGFRRPEERVAYQAMGAVGTDEDRPRRPAAVRKDGGNTLVVLCEVYDAGRHPNGIGLESPDGREKDGLQVTAM